MTGRRAERRGHVRRPAPDPGWLRGARLRSGSGAVLMDVSPGGTLLQTAARLRPGMRTVLQLKTRDGELRVPGEVVRAWVAAIQSDRGVIYRGAVRFDRPIDLPEAG